MSYKRKFGAICEEKHRDEKKPRCGDMTGSKIKQEKESGLLKHPVSGYSRRQSRLLLELLRGLADRINCGSVLGLWWIGYESENEKMANLSHFTVGCR